MSNFPSISTACRLETETAAVKFNDIDLHAHMNDYVLKVHRSDAVEDNTDVIVLVVNVTCLVAAILLFSVYLYHRRRQTTGLTKSPELGGEDNDLQIDGVRSQYSSQNEVRGELGVAEHLLPRPELPRTVNGADTRLPGNVPTFFPRYGQQPTCKCEPVRNCQCYLTGLPDTQNTQIHKSDEYLLIVSKYICHNERHLYDELNLSDAEVFAKEEDRRADVNGITVNDKVISLLNRWVEIGPPETVTLPTLMKALCKSDFHTINQKIVQKLQTDGVSLLDNDNGGVR